MKTYFSLQLSSMINHRNDSNQDFPRSRASQQAQAPAGRTGVTSTSHSVRPASARLPNGWEQSSTWSGGSSGPVEPAGASVEMPEEDFEDDASDYSCTSRTSRATTRSARHILRARERGGDGVGRVKRRGRKRLLAIGAPTADANAVLSLPFTELEIIDSSFEQFSIMVTDARLSAQQIQLLRDIRRRGTHPILTAQFVLPLGIDWGGGIDSHSWGATPSMRGSFAFPAAKFSRPYSMELCFLFVR